MRSTEHYSHITLKIALFLDKILSLPSKKCRGIRHRRMVRAQDSYPPEADGSMDRFFEIEYLPGYTPPAHG